MRIMQLRCEIARLEGFRNHADKKLHDRMMGSGEKALAFVDEMLQRLRPLQEARTAELLQFASDFSGKQQTALAPWDVEFYRARMAESKARFNTAQLRPYLEQESVLRGMMSIFSDLFGLRITELPAEWPQAGGAPQPGKVCVWHPQVRVFAVHDAATGVHYGSFYLDLYSRRGKQSISWSQTLSLGTPAEGGGVGQPHLSAMMLNLTPPQEGKPKLLSHMETRVLFHEFGHILHMLLGHGELREQASANQAIDFVELPSHLAEKWAWQPEVLCSFAKHYETGEPLPQALAERLAQYHCEQLEDECLRSLLVAKLDLELHTHYFEKFHGKTLDGASAELLAPWQLPTTVQQPSAFRNLPHCLTVGYDACFYSYTFAEVMAEDVFSVFREHGTDNAAMGASYRRAMLEPGSSIPAAELYRRFMGRPPHTDAFLNKIMQKQ
jgi:oligopeptidase A